MSSPPLKSVSPRLADMVQFVLRPRFTGVRDRLDGAAVVHVIRLLFATIGVMLFVSPFLMSAVTAVMGEVPTNANAEMAEIDPSQLFLWGIVFAPLFEELIFRSWLGGRRAALIGLPALATVMTVMAVAAHLASRGESAASPFPAVIVLAILIVGVSQIAVRVWRADPRTLDNALRRLFPVALWGSVVLFGLLHLSNFEGGLSHPILILAVVPQALVALPISYVRMRYGLLAAMGFHAAYNGVLISMSVLAMQAVETVPA